MIQNKVKSKLIFTEKRFNAGYFLNEDALNSFKLEINPQNCIALSELANVFNPPIFKRQFCQPSERAINYCQSSDVTNALEGSDVYINKKQAEKVGSIVKKNQILVTGFGTIGNTRLVNELSEGISYANNVCRIESNGKFPYGFLYAFMTSKFGRSQLNKNASGSVVRYIEAPGIKRTLVPILPEEKQQQIHQLIVDSANLRVEANKLLKEAQSTLISKLDLKERVNTNISNSIKLSAIKRSHQVRFESSFYTSKGSKLKETIVNQNDCILLGELSERIFRPGIFKRNYVSNGIDFLGGSDITKSIPDSEKKLSPTKTSNINELKLEEDWILVTCGGTIGTSVYVNNYLSKKLASQHILRVVPNKVLSGYLFAFLSSDVGVEIVKSFTYGSVIPQIEPHHLEKIPIPILDEKLMEEINLDVISYKNKIDEAILKENQAINLIEKEIDAWQ